MCLRYVDESDQKRAQGFGAQRLRPVLGVVDFNPNAVVMYQQVKHRTEERPCELKNQVADPKPS